MIQRCEVELIVILQVATVLYLRGKKQKFGPDQRVTNSYNYKCVQIYWQDKVLIMVCQLILLN